MKKKILTLMILSLIASLYGCSASSERQEETKKETTIVVEEKQQENNETKPEEAQPIIEEEKQQEKKEEVLIRPEVQEAIDSYEAFIDGYIAFMVEYADSNNDMSMLMDYLQFLNSYAEMIEKMDALEADLNDAELLYYTEVMLRCSQKLLSVE